MERRARIAEDTPAASIRLDSRTGDDVSVGQPPARSRTTQGLAPHVEDPAVLARVAQLLTSGRG
jgi:hypothetical protein